MARDGVEAHAPGSVSDSQITAIRPQHATHLDEESVEVTKMLEDQTAHRRIERRIAERQRLMHIVDHEAHVRGGYLATRPFEHVLGEIHCRDPGTRFSHPGGVPAGPATEIQHVAAAYAAERLLESRQRIGVVGH